MRSTVTAAASACSRKWAATAATSGGRPCSRASASSRARAPSSCRPPPGQVLGQPGQHVPADGQLPPLGPVLQEGQPAWRGQAAPARRPGRRPAGWSAGPGSVRRGGPVRGTGQRGADHLLLAGVQVVQELHERFHGPDGQVLQVLHDEQVAVPGRLQGVSPSKVLASDSCPLPARSGTVRAGRGGQERDHQVGTAAGDFLDEGVYQVRLARARGSMEEQRAGLGRPAGTEARRDVLHGQQCRTILGPATKRANVSGGRCMVRLFPPARARERQVRGTALDRTRVGSRGKLINSQLDKSLRRLKEGR